METPLVQPRSSKTKWFAISGVAVVIIAAALFLGKTNLQKGSIEELVGDQTDGQVAAAPVGDCLNPDSEAFASPECVQARESARAPVALYEGEPPEAIAAREAAAAAAECFDSTNAQRFASQECTEMREAAATPAAPYYETYAVPGSTDGYTAPQPPPPEPESESAPPPAEEDNQQAPPGEGEEQNQKPKPDFIPHYSVEIIESKDAQGIWKRELRAFVVNQAENENASSDKQISVKVEAFDQNGQLLGTSYGSVLAPIPQGTVNPENRMGSTASMYFGISPEKNIKDVAYIKITVDATKAATETDENNNEIEVRDFTVKEKDETRQPLNYDFFTIE